MHTSTRILLTLTLVGGAVACERRDEQANPRPPQYGMYTGPLPGIVLVADTAAAGVPSTHDDTTITARVLAALSADPTLADLPISVSTEQGVVRLQGAVNSVTAVRRASAIVIAVQGVTGVDNRLSLLVSQ